jgi:hypothetical protein
VRNAAHGAVQKRLRKLEEYSEYSSKSIFLSIASTKSMGLFGVTLHLYVLKQLRGTYSKYVYLNLPTAKMVREL